MNIDLAAGDIATEHESIAGASAIVVRAGQSSASDWTTEFVASTEDEDRAMDVVRQDWRLAEFRANPVILDNHNPMRVVGRGDSAKVPKAGEGGDVGKLMILVRWDKDSPDPSIRTVGHQHVNGFRSAGSVGFRSGKKTLRSKLATDHAAYREPVKVSSPWGDYEYSGYYYEQNTLLEFSSATVPMNPKALQRAMAGEVQLAERLAEIDTADLARRLAVVEQTVTRDLAADLRSHFADPALRADLVSLLVPDFQAAMRSDAQFARIVRGLVESTPTPRKGLASLILANLEKQ